MRIERLKVESFRGVEAAEVALGPGLNLLYGPNDLGKSTLASAIAAALLVQPGTKAGEAYQPWHLGAPARVELVLRDATGRFWRIEKSFGAGASATARLYSSKDGVQYDLEGKDRQVEGEIRQKLLRWGIPEPGGKGGPRGMPTSFLVRVLLAEQTDVAPILEASISTDPDEEQSRLRLTEALQALAQDPRLKQVLNEAQKEHDRYFTPTGRDRKHSPARQLKQELDRLRTTDQALQAIVDSSCSAEEEVARLNSVVRDCKDRRDQARETLKLAEQREAAARVRQDAQRALDGARQRLQAIQEAEERARQKGVEAAARATAQASAEAALAQATATVTTAHEAFEGAKSALDRARSGEAESARRLERAELENEIARLDGVLRALALRGERVDDALKLQRARSAAADRVTQASADLAKDRLAFDAASDALNAADAEVALARGLRTFHRWKQAVLDLERARERMRRVGSLRADAATVRTEADALRTEIAAAPALPSSTEIADFRKLYQALQVAEAALGGGSLELRPKRPLRLSTRIDGRDARTEPGLAGPLTIEGDRRIEVSVDDLLDLEVTAGTSEARARVTELRARWSREAQPTLTRLKVADLDALVVRRAARDRQEARLAEVQARAITLEEEAAREEKDAVDVETLEAGVHEREAELDPFDRPKVEDVYSTLGADRDRAVEGRARQADDERGRRSAARAAAQRKLDGAATALETAKGEVARLDVEWETARTRLVESLPTSEPAPESAEDLEALARRVESDQRDSSAKRDALQKRHRGLAEGATAEIAGLEQALTQARTRVEDAKASQESAQRALDSARSARDRADAQQKVLADQAAAMDRAGAETACNDCAAALGALPALDPPFEVKEVEDAQRRLQEAEGALQHAERKLSEESGALKSAGGPAAEQDLREVREAIRDAERREHDVDLDGKAWKLLREVLVETEKSHGQHLGKKLAPAVTKRFAELTNGRYAEVRFAPTLQAENVAIPGLAPIDGILAALSLGTREQLATLLRVVIAEQLKSVIVLDDHLVQADPSRLAWFRDLLSHASLETQVIVLACRPEDYLEPDELPGPSDPSFRDLAGGQTRVIDLSRVIARWRPEVVSTVSPGGAP